MRIPKHAKDFGGFKLLDSIVSDNPIEIEDKIREWLRINSKLIRGKTINKQTTDTELFVVGDGEEYAMIVNVANSFAKMQEKKLRDRIGHQNDLEREPQKIRVRQAILTHADGDDAAADADSMILRGQVDGKGIILRRIWRVNLVSRTRVTCTKLIGSMIPWFSQTAKSATPMRQTSSAIGLCGHIELCKLDAGKTVSRICRKVTLVKGTSLVFMSDGNCKK